MTYCQFHISFMPEDKNKSKNTKGERTAEWWIEVNWRDSPCPCAPLWNSTLPPFGHARAWDSPLNHSHFIHLQGRFGRKAFSKRDGMELRSNKAGGSLCWLEIKDTTPVLIRSEELCKAVVWKQPCQWTQCSRPIRAIAIKITLSQPRRSSEVTLHFISVQRSTTFKLAHMH